MARELNRPDDSTRYPKRLGHHDCVSVGEIVDSIPIDIARKKHKRHKDLDSLWRLRFFAANLTFALKDERRPLSKTARNVILFREFPPSLYGSDVLNAPKQTTCEKR